MEGDGKMERTRRGLAFAAGFCLLFVLVSLAAAMAAYNIAGDRYFLGTEMRRHSEPKYSGLPDAQYQEMGRMVADYLTGRREDFQYSYKDEDGNTVTCFQPHEAAHMADCRKLIGATGKTRWILGGAALMLVIGALLLWEYRRSFAAGLLTGCGAGAAACAGILVWGIADFGGLFTVFHRLLFDNDGWLLNERTDMLIRLMPTSFFISLGIRILLAAAAVMMVCFTTGMMIRMIGNNDGE